MLTSRGYCSLAGLQCDKHDDSLLQFLQYERKQNLKRCAFNDDL